MPDETHIERLAGRLGVEWPNLAAARSLTAGKMQALNGEVSPYASSDLSVVVFGSLARRELTPGSDPDWTLLVDGAADPRHVDTSRERKPRIEHLFDAKPGREGVFGNLSFSHELVHQIGGQDDTNRNTTRRILLLLESDVVGRADAYHRVIASVLKRYLLEDQTFARRRADHHVPRFLLNDFARYWRTMAVDFAYKARARGGEGAAIRNFKLRMSRKLIYVAGLLACFSCEMGFATPDGAGDCRKSSSECVDCLRSFMCKPPLEVVAAAMLHLGDRGASAARTIIDAYDEFVGVLADKDRRETLAGLGPEALESQAFAEARRVSHAFRDGVMGMFFEADDKLAELTRNYGVF